MEEEEEVEGKLSPMKGGELCSSAVETKGYTVMQSECDMQKQLRADMHVCAVKQLASLGVEEAKKVKVLRCYGLLAPVQGSQIQLLRMTMDFKEGSLKYKALLNSTRPHITSCTWTATD